jgi:hypothetical protein
MPAINTYSWNTDSSGFWSDASNWSPSGPPTNGSTVVIDPSGTTGFSAWDDISNLTVTLDDADPHADVQVGFGGSAELVVKGGTNAGELEVRENGLLVLKHAINNTGGGIEADSGFGYNVELDGTTITGGALTLQSDTAMEVVKSSKIVDAAIYGQETGIGITGGSTLTLDNTSVSDESLVGFDSTGNTLVINNVPMFQGSIYGLAGNTIDLTAFSYADLNRETLSSSGQFATLTLHASDGARSLDLLGQYVASFNPPPGQAGFQISADAHGGTLITYVAPPAAT